MRLHPIFLFAFTFACDGEKTIGTSNRAPDAAFVTPLDGEEFDEATVVEFYGVVGDDGPVDFGVLLDGIISGVRQIQADMKALDAPTTADLDAIKERLEDIQKGDMARICAAGPQVQQRYGLSAMASIFSPLSGAERRLNRMWACLVDRHWPEAMASIDGAVENLDSAQRAVQDAVAA